MARFFGERLEELRADYASERPLKEIAAKWRTSLGGLQRLVRRHNFPRRMEATQRANMADALHRRLGRQP